MGWGMGIGIGWPNASAGSSPIPPVVYTYYIYYCGQSAPDATVYSSSSSYVPGIYVYDDPELTIPSNLIGAPGPFPVAIAYIVDGLVGEFSVSCS